ncbi:IMPACT family protein [Actinobacillus delphinicola]|uniref:YigZ family protein n=1 Tax=Actinobacillus delphinicola TaxID=51161 RepID=UPI0024434100|nr:YigZ family protein [Actinobacillus delphinicola]MDG6897512.1 IMPACT family protein [Actinobacillus delphinicola]
MQYFVPKNLVVFEEEIKKSRFITYIHRTTGMEEAKQFWLWVRMQHPQACHHCWATVAEAPTYSQGLGFSDDGEPAGTAGKPMLACLQGSNIGEITAVVVRYFGGVLLGTGGLVRAYSNGVQQALKQVETVLKVERKPYQLVCDYAQINLVQNLCKQYDVLIETQDFQAEVRFVLAISADKVATFQQALSDNSSGQLCLESKE